MMVSMYVLMLMFRRSVYTPGYLSWAQPTPQDTIPSSRGYESTSERTVSGPPESPWTDTSLGG